MLTCTCNNSFCGPLFSSAVHHCVYPGSLLHISESCTEQWWLSRRCCPSYSIPASLSSLDLLVEIHLWWVTRGFLPFAHTLHAQHIQHLAGSDLGTNRTQAKISIALGFGLSKTNIQRNIKTFFLFRFSDSRLCVNIISVRDRTLMGVFLYHRLMLLWPSWVAWPLYILSLFTCTAGAERLDGPKLIKLPPLK